WKSESGLLRIIGYERAMSQILRLTVLSGTFALLWWLALKLDNGVKLAVSGAGFGIASAVFALIRKWFTSPALNTGDGSFSSKALGILKIKAPQLIAWIALLLFFILTGTGVYAFGVHPFLESWIVTRNFWGLFAGSLFALLFTAFFFNPARVG